MSAIKILMDKLIDWLHIAAFIVLLPVIVTVLVVLSCRCDDYEWEGIGYDD